VRPRGAWALVAAVCVAAASVLGACGSDDNGGVIQGPTGTSVAPGTTAPAGGTTATTAY